MKANSSPPYPICVAASVTSPDGRAGARSTARFSSGSPPRAATRRSMSTNPAASTAPAAMQPKHQAGQPSSCPSTSGSTISSTAQAPAARPARSSLEVRPAPGAPVPVSSGGTRRGTAAASTIPIGTLMANTGRQPVPNKSAVTTTPPSTSPATAPADSTAA